MSKESTPLEAFHKLKGYIPLDWEETKLVEKTLKDYEIMKGSVCIAKSIGLDICRKRDKALEIIKNIFPSMEIVRDYQSPQKRYLLRLKEDYCINGKITKIVLKVITKEEEYDLLKEVLI